MKEMIGYLAMLLPIAYWWRFGNAKLDRDFAPYAYAGVFGGYLRNGHHDVKPPLIHGAYWLWLRLLRNVNLSLERKLRLLPAVAMALTVGLLNYTHGAGNAWALALLWSSPFVWPHMANTEWLTAFLCASWFALLPGYPVIAWLLLGSSVWVNQKNLALIFLVGGISLLDRGLDIYSLWVFFPGAVLFGIVAFNDRWREWLVDYPAKMSKTRTFEANTMGAFHLLRPWFYEAIMFVPFLALDGPWFLLPIGVAALAIVSKQIVPHHFILIAYALAVAVKPSTELFVGFGLAFAVRSLWVWLDPQRLYPATFPFLGGGVRHYGVLLEDAVSVENFVAGNLREGEAFQVIGFENQLYLNAGHPAVDMEICEANRTEARPRIVVLSGATGHDWDATGYRQAFQSPLGIYWVFIKGEE